MLNYCVCCNGTVAISNYKSEFKDVPIAYCNSCGHLQLAQPLSEEYLAGYYGENYSIRRKHFLGAAYSGVMERRADAQIRFLSRHISLRNARILDYGCGYGFLMEKLKDYSRNVRGVEYDPLCVSYCTKNNLSVDLLKNNNALGELGGFDCIVLSHVLEHCNDVKFLLQKLKGKADFLFFEVPAYKAGLAEQFKAKEGHINFFNSKSLVLLLENMNLRIVSIGSFGPSLNFFWLRRHCLFRGVLRVLGRDYFFNKYEYANPDGIWIRALVSSR